jgi:DNA-binding transcriptional regulator LsrR (DeoR family)
MPRKPTPPPEGPLARLRAARAEEDAARLRTLDALRAAKAAGATGEQLAAAMGVTSRQVHRLLAAAGDGEG